MRVVPQSVRLVPSYWHNFSYSSISHNKGKDCEADYEDIDDGEVELEERDNAATSIDETDDWDAEDGFNGDDGIFENFLQIEVSF